MVKVAISFAINVALIRLVEPASFGVLAMGTIVSGVFGLFISLGSGYSLIYHSAVNSDVLSSIFWLNIFTGILFGAILGFSGNVIVDFYGEPQLRVTCWILGFSLLLQSFSIVPLAILQKQLAFEKLFFVDLIALILAGIGAIFSAFSDWGLFSLLLNIILYGLIKLFSAFFLSNWFPSFHFSFSLLKPHLNYGGPLIIENLLGFTVRNIDDLIIGKWLGDIALGIYNRSYSVLLFPLNNFSKIISSVLFPVFSLINDDRNKVKNHFLKTCRLMSSIVFPSVAILFLTADQLVLIVMGEKWQSSVSVIRIFSVLAAFQSIGSLTGVIFQSMGATRLQMKVSFVVKPFLIGMIITGLWVTKSIEGVALFYTIASIIAVPELYYSGKLIGVTLKEIGNSVFYPILLSLLSVVMTYSLINNLLPANLWSGFLYKTTAFLALYLMLFRFIAANQWEELSIFFLQVIKQV